MQQAVQRGPRSDSGARGDVEDASSRSAAASRAVEGRRHRGCVRALIFGDNDLCLGHAEAGGKVGSVAGPGGGGDDSSTSSSVSADSTRHWPIAWRH